MNIFKRIKIIRISRIYKILIICLGIGFISVSFSNFRNKDFELAKNLEVYHTLFRELNIYYVDEIDPGKLIKTSIDRMLGSLDPYTTFIPESKIEDYKMMFTGEYGGIGALIRQSGENIIVSEPYENSPAQKAGVKAGDILIEVDGNLVKGKSSTDVSDLLKSQTKSKIRLTIERPGVPEQLKFEFEREKIRIDNVPYYGVINNTGYIRATGFTVNAGNEVKDAFTSINQSNDINGLILDLRGNPGGLLKEAVNMVNVFVDKGIEVVSTKGKVNQWNKTYYTQYDAVDGDIPLIVLVNSGSASASEIVAGAMQDIDRAVIIGHRTYGKGLVQITRQLSYNNQLKLTTAKYYIPSGRCIQALDYSHRNVDGSVGKIPDSLITKYSTLNGRTVYDGGGIKPDFELERHSFSELSVMLVSKNHIFDFATQYVIDHPTIPPPEEFSITDEDYSNFINFLDGKDYDYKSGSDKAIENLVKVAKQEKYYDIIRNEINAVKDKLVKNSENDFEIFKDEIFDLINSEIASRYYYQRGRIQSLLRTDPEVKKALEILSDMDKYNKTLSVQ